MNSIERQINYSESRFNNNEFKMSNKELISKFRVLIRDSDIHFSMKDELLLCFIRARKYDLHRSLKLLKNYVRMVKKYPDLFSNLRVERFAHLLCFLDKHFLVSPIREQNGRQIIMLNARDWDFNACSVDFVFCGILMVLQRIIACTENQKKGVVFLLDFKDFTLAHVRQFTPALVKKLADLIQDVFPIRLIGIHIVHEPLVLKILVTMIWPFLSYKIRNRLFFHGYCFETLHEHIDPACLPSEYDGQLGLMSETMGFTKSFPEEKYPKIFDCFN